MSWTLCKQVFERYKVFARSPLHCMRLNLHYIPPFVVKCQRLQGICLYLCLCGPPTIHPANICSAPGPALCCTLPGARQQHLCGGGFGLSSLTRDKPLCSLSGWQSASPLSVETRPSLARPQRIQLCLIIWSDRGYAKETTLSLSLLTLLLLLFRL